MSFTSPKNVVTAFRVSCRWNSCVQAWRVHKPPGVSFAKTSHQIDMLTDNTEAKSKWATHLSQTHNHHTSLFLRRGVTPVPSLLQVSQAVFNVHYNAVNYKTNAKEYSTLEVSLFAIRALSFVKCVTRAPASCSGSGAYGRTSLRMQLPLYTVL